jgi:hypothetical protein
MSEAISRACRSALILSPFSIDHHWFVADAWGPAGHGCMAR